MTAPAPVLMPSFAPLKAPGTVTAGLPLLDPRGPRVVLGWEETALAVPIVPGPASLFGPRGVCLHPDGSLWVADSGHHRLLGWRRLPIRDNQPADLLIGQPDFRAEGRNAKGEASRCTLNVPTGVATFGQGLAVADAWNHRVLIWRTTPARDNQPADLILGQAEADGMLANRGADRPSAESLHWPYGVAAIEGRLAVADSGNRRVLIWDAPAADGQAADHVLGQKRFSSRDENAGAAISAFGMRWPHAIALWHGRFAVADAGNNRVMLYDGAVPANGSAVAMLGQAAVTAGDHNGGSYFPSAATLNMPYALAVAGDRLLVADTANSRLVGYGTPEGGAAATWLTGQTDFAAKGDNRWGLLVRDSLCWPYGLAVGGRTVAIADSGNNRVLLWDLAP